jgi:predicted amidohydrolase
MMICWDVHFPEVARNLANNGAEVIAMPIWGGNPTLAKARAIENQVFLVTSTYTDPNRDWMKTTIIDKEGKMLSIGKDWGTLVMAEVNLSQPKLWRFLGNFRERIYRERPVEGFVEPSETR